MGFGGLGVWGFRGLGQGARQSRPASEWEWALIGSVFNAIGCIGVYRVRVSDL